MGNTNTSPSLKANQTFAKFLEKHGDDLKKNADNFKEQFRLFSVFVENFIHNDEEYLKFDEEEQKVCLASLIYLFNASSFNSIDLNFMKEALKINKGFGKGLTGAQMVQKLVKSRYAWDGSDFFEWDNESKTVIKCTEANLNCDRFVAKMSRSAITLPDFHNKIMIDGVADLTKFIEEVLAAATEFAAGANREDTVAEIKETITKNLLDPHIIPCYTGPFNVLKGSMRRFYTKDDFLAGRLPYDPDQDTTPLVEKFVGKFKCPSEVLANHFMRCGVDVDRTLTIICGPENSGKRTLVNVTKALYNSVDAIKARTCFIDDLDETFLSDFSNSNEHPCAHLIVICRNNDVSGNTGSVFGNRTVQRVSLEAPIEQDDRVENMSTKLNTRRQLGSLLGWAYKKCDISELGLKSSSNPGNSMNDLSSLATMLGGLNDKLDERIAARKGMLDDWNSRMDALFATRKVCTHTSRDDSSSSSSSSD